jgi:dTDP-glucose pyrophosphorylase
VSEALVKINNLSGDAMTLFVVNNAGSMCGTLTDGDIRRGLIAGAALSEKIERLMRSDFLAIRSADNTLALLDKARSRGVKLLPILDAADRIERVVNLRKVRSLLPLDAVLMAGGRGERLRPLTLTTPKPLLPVGGKAIIDYNVEAFASYGITNVFATVNYLKEKLQEHFSEPVAGVRVRCIEEPAPLGTFGSLAYVDALAHDNLIVMNSDLLTGIDFEAMFKQHINSGAAITIAAVPYTVSVPYAIMRTEGDSVKGLEEKPTFNYFANAGVYILSRNVVAKIVKGERLDAPDFIEQLIAEGAKVTYYPIDGSWTDIGSPDDYRYACEVMNRSNRFR